MKTLKILAFLLVLIFSRALGQQPIIIDHTCTNLAAIPDEWITKAKKDLHIFYGHTSHGSQLTVGGMAAMVRYFGTGTKYAYGTDATDGSKLYLYEDFDENDITKDNWIQPTRDYLTAHTDCNVVMWSWCSFSKTTDFVQAYLDDMEQLITDYPNVRFVFMTGHNDKGETAQIVANRKQIREHCIAHNRILYDFTDIEAYDPDGDFFGDWDASGNLLPRAQMHFLDMDISYNMDGASTPEGNWGLEWMADHPTDPLTAMSADDMCTDCAHSNGDDGRNYNSRIHCILKGIAMWRLCARLAGWEGVPSSVQIPENDETIKVYPNPADDLIHIMLGKNFQEATVEVFDASGRKVLVKTNVASPQLSIDLSGFPKGIYYVNVILPGKETGQKVVIL